MSQTELVLQGIKAMITGGQLQAGSLLPTEKELCGTFGVSRGVLREGVRALCIMGVLETRRGAGTFVTSLDARLLLAPIGFMIDLQTPEQRRDLQAVLRVLMPEAAARAALMISSEQLAEAAEALEGLPGQVFADRITERGGIMEADAAFFRIVARASDNGALAVLVDALTERALATRGAIGADHVETNHVERTRTASQRHAAILDALKQRDPDRARVLMSHDLLELEDANHWVGGSLVPIAEGDRVPFPLPETTRSDV